MKTSQIVELKINETISIQQERCGYTITGPATLVVLKDIDAKELQEQQTLQPQYQRRD